MANLPLNSAYGIPLSEENSSPNPIGLKYANTQNQVKQQAPAPLPVPSATYANLSKLRGSGISGFTPDVAPVHGSDDEYWQKQAGISQYGRLLNNGMGIATQTQFLPPTGDIKAPIEIPQDYGTFMEPMSFNENGEKLSWGTPTKPVIRNTVGDVPGQYVQDTTDPSLLAKTIRGSNPIADKAILNYRQSSMYNIDHIMPLALGGADTLANRQLLTKGQHDQKTKAQAIPYTLYAYGQVSLSQARAMAMTWKDKDLTGVPMPDSNGLIPNTEGRTGLEIAKDTAERWTQPPKMTVKGFMAQLPDTMKNFGEGVLPDPIREAIKGFASEVTFGFLPYEQDDDEGAAAWIGGKIGYTAGMLSTFALGGMLIKGAVSSVKGLAAGSKALKSLRGVAKAKLAESSGVKLAAESLTRFKEKAAPSIISKILQEESLNVGQLAARASAIASSGRGLQMAKLAGASAVIGQARQFIENKFNPDILSGEQLVNDVGFKDTMGRIATDLALGSLYGAGGKTAGGLAYSMAVPTTISFLSNPYDPANAIADGIIFGALHAHSTFMKPGTSGKFLPSYGVPEGFKSIRPFGPKWTVELNAKLENIANRSSYRIASEYAPGLFPEIKTGQSIPKIDPKVLVSGEKAAIENIKQRMVFRLEADKQLKASNAIDDYSSKVSKAINSLKEIPGLKASEFFSLKARRERSATKKAQDELIKQEFGKDFTSRSKLSEEILPIEEFGVNAMAHLAEIKRIKVAFRQLYKSGLVGEMRGKADLDDILSVSEKNRRNRVMSQETNYNENPSQPKIIKTIVDAFDESILKNTFDNEPFNKNGEFLNGTFAATGMSVGGNVIIAKEIMAKIDKGEISRNFILISRPDMAPLNRMRDGYIDLRNKEGISKGNDYVKDPHPEYVGQLWAFGKDSKTGGRVIYEFPGFVASEQRLNRGQKAINKWVMEKNARGENADGRYKILDHSKDPLLKSMDEKNLDFLIVTLDPSATSNTFSSGNPYIPLYVKDGNWRGSLAVKNKLAQQGFVPTEEVAIAKFENAKSSKAKAEAIEDLKKAVVAPATDHLPAPETVVNPVNDRMSVPREVTKNLFEWDRFTEATSPEQIKKDFIDNLGWNLTDIQAKEIFSKKKDMPLKEAVKMLVEAVNKGETDKATALKVMMSESYLKNMGSIKNGKAILEMPVFGKVKKPVEKSTTLTQPAVQEGSVKTQELMSSESTAVSQSVVSPLADRMQKEYLNIKKLPGASTSPISKPEMAGTSKTKPVNEWYVNKLAKQYIEEGKLKLEDKKFEDRGYSEPDHSSVISSMEQRVQSDLQGKTSNNYIYNVKMAVRNELKNYSDMILPEIPKGKYGQDIKSMSTEEQSSLYNKERNVKMKVLAPEDLLVTSPERIEKRDGSGNPIKDNKGRTLTLETGKQLPSSDLENIIKDNGQPLTRDEAAAYFKSKGYVIEESGMKLVNDYEKLGNNTPVPTDRNVVNELNKYLPPKAGRSKNTEVSLDELHKDIKSNIDNSDPNISLPAKMFDSGLTKMLGKDWQKDPYLSGIIEKWMKNKFSVDSDAYGKPITQPKKVVEARATGDLELEKKYKAERNVDILVDRGVDSNIAKGLIDRYGSPSRIPFEEMGLPSEKNPGPLYTYDKSGVLKSVKNVNNVSKKEIPLIKEKSSGGMTEKELSEAGLSPDIGEKGFKGLNVKTTLQQEKDLIHDLTRGEELLSGGIYDPNQTTLSKVLSIRRLFLGDNNFGDNGLRAEIINNHPAYEYGKKKGPSLFGYWDVKSKSWKEGPIIQEARNIDLIKKPKIESISDVIRKTLKKYKDTLNQNYDEALDAAFSEMETLGKLVDDYKSGEPLPTGLTEKTIKELYPELAKKLKESADMVNKNAESMDLIKYQTLGQEEMLREIEKNVDTAAGRDAEGGPGYHDGKGGIGDMFSNLWGKLRKKNQGVQAHVIQPTPPAVDDFDYDKFLKALRLSETSVVKGDPYSTWQPSGVGKYGKALGAYRVTESDLVQKSKRYLDKTVTSDEFLKNPQLQDSYILNQTKYRRSEGYTPQQIVDFHKKGTGVLLGPDAYKYKPGSTNYQDQETVDRFMEIYNSLLGK